MQVHIRKGEVTIATIRAWFKFTLRLKLRCVSRARYDLRKCMKAPQEFSGNLPEVNTQDTVKRLEKCGLARYSITNTHRGPFINLVVTK